MIVGSSSLIETGTLQLVVGNDREAGACASTKNWSDSLQSLERFALFSGENEEKVYKDLGSNESPITRSTKIREAKAVSAALLRLRGSVQGFVQLLRLPARQFCR
jgi:hypothetical protein